MTRLSLIASFLLLAPLMFAAEPTPLISDASSPASPLPDTSSTTENRTAKWQKVQSTKWYDLFELSLSDRESLFCDVTYKSDAQLAIGIVMAMAKAANERGWKYIRVNKGIPTGTQLAEIESLIQKKPLFKNFSRVEYLKDKPENESGLFDAEFISKMLKGTEDTSSSTTQ